MALTVEKLKEGDCEYAVGGRLDGTTARQLEAALRPVLSNPDTKSLVLRMTDLDFISSAGIRVLIETQNTLSSRGGSVLLVDLQPQIAKVLEIIKALPGITVFRNIEEMDEYLATIQKRVKSGE